MSAKRAVARSVLSGPFEKRASLDELPQERLSSSSDILLSSPYADGTGKPQVNVDGRSHGRTPHCPFKGDATNYSLPDTDDVAGCYEIPIEEMQAISGKLAFDAEKVTEQMR
ncbi:DUF427 domain-containing protein [Halomonas aquatica]|uniref:DUF427 domain-containing protein n=1 Tax=Halomonas aquatica TaxID=3151123 RepID=A0ABV1NBA2_9GAMM